MSTLLYTLGRWSYRHAWRVLVGWLLILLIGGAAALTFMTGTDNSFKIPGTEAQEGIALLNRTFPEASGTSAQYVIVAADGDSIEDEAYTDAIGDAVDQLEDLDGVLAVTDPYDDLVSGTISDDDSAAILRLQFDGEATDVSDETKDALEDIGDELSAAIPDGAQAVVGGDLFSTSVPALTITEAVGVLIALFVLIVTFRSLVVSWFPLTSALIGVALSVALIFVATAFTTISSTTPMLAIMLGLAVGIDYALFIVSRHQDQVRAGVEPEESAARATGTAGSAVAFAGVTVLIALIGLSFAGIPFLTTMGIAAAVAVAIAVVVAVTLTPALLGFAKGRVAGWRRRGSRASASSTSASASSVAGDAATDAPATPTAAPAKVNAWVRIVTTHPVIATVAVVLGLGLVAIPATQLTLALPNAGMLAEEDEARQAYDLTAEHFGPGANGPLILTGTIVTSDDPLTLADDVAAAVEDVPGVAEVALSTPNQTADTLLVQIVPETAPDDPATADLVRELRSHHDEWEEEFGVDLIVTGFTAVAIDISDRLGEALIPFGIFVVGLSLILLMIVFRSIWVPLKAAVGYLLSVAAAFGVISVVFEWGWFADLLNVEKTGPVISFMPIILMGVLFGLAMDYEVFLVSRMREDYVHARRRNPHANARETAVAAVRTGFSASARVVTAAAVIMFAVFAAFVPEGDSSIKAIALGLAVGIVVDAFLIRMTLGPAVMALLGDKAWWMPRWLERILPHFDIEGEAVERELELRAWPEPHTTAAIVAEDLELIDEDGALYRDVTVRVEPGGALILHGDDDRAPRALALSIAGRVAPTGGRIRTGGHLLPERAAWVRSHVPVAFVDGAEDPAEEVRRAARAASDILVIDGLDRLPTHHRDEALAWLRTALTTVTLTLVASVADPELGRSLVRAAGFAEIAEVDLSPQTPGASSAIDSSEVYA